MSEAKSDLAKRKVFMERQAFIHGIYPRSDKLIVSGRGLDRGRISVLEHEEVESAAFDSLLKLQKSRGFLLVEDGKFTWQDIFRPFAQSAEGIEVGPLTRWFDTNTFYRQPVITGTPSLDTKKFDTFVPTTLGVRQKVTLPSPLTFARLCSDARADKFIGTLRSVTELLAATVAHLAERGIEAIQFNEPYLVYANQEEDIDYLFRSLVDVVGARKIFSIIHFYFGDGASVLRAFEEREAPIDVVGADFYKTKITDIPRDFSKVLLAGVINSQNTSVENKGEIEEFIEQLLEQARPSRLFLTHNCDLEFVPQTVANQKVALLGELIK